MSIRAVKSPLTRSRRCCRMTSGIPHRALLPSPRRGSHSQRQLQIGATVVTKIAHEIEYYLNEHVMRPSFMKDACTYNPSASPARCATPRAQRRCRVRSRPPDHPLTRDVPEFPMTHPLAIYGYGDHALPQTHRALRRLKRVLREAICNNREERSCDLSRIRSNRNRFHWAFWPA